MAREDYIGRIAMLRSKVGRGMFLLFVGCAILPVVALALITVLDVRAHLDGLAEKRLRQASKSAGMTVVERISFLETDMDLIALDLPVRDAVPGQPLPERIRRRIDNRFRSLVVLSPDQRTIRRLGGQEADYPRLRPEGRAHVSRGGTLVATVGAGPAGRVFIIRLRDFAAPDGDLLAGEVEPGYLWGGEGFVSPTMDLCVLGPAGETLFASAPDHVPTHHLARAMAAEPTGRFEWRHEGDNFLSGYWTLFMEPTYHASWVIVQSELQAEVQRPLKEFGLSFSLVILGTLLVVTFTSLRQIRRRTGPVEQLLEATRRLKAEDFSYRLRITSDDEFAALGEAFNDMTESIERHLVVTSTLNRIGVSLSAEKDEARLLETVLLGAQAVFNADGGGLFLLADGQAYLSLAHVKSLPVWQRPPAPVRNGAVLARPAGHALMPPAAGATERTITAADVHDAADDGFAALREFDRRMGYRSRSFISVPLRNHDNEVIGILQLINGQDRTTGEIIPFSDEDQRLVESLASQAAVAITKNRLVEDFKGLFEGLTDLISTAIDEQSPHTGGHVRRVVVLSTMIAEALSRSSDPALRERALSDEELYELKIAALLHDCGKLTTPVYLTDKATKLQAIVDRMRLVEARAETARRQHRIGLLKEAVRRMAPGEGRELLAAVDTQAADFDHQIDEDLAVLRQCNQGAEYMDDSLSERMREIGGRYSWLNMAGQPEALLTDDEMHHLSIRRGTLTSEERAVVEGHVASTIRMLERLPYPKRLRNVPRYAGAHHERLSGVGYPRRLAGDEIPIQGRIIAIADVLEALTARDRPYRRAMGLSEAIRTLGELARTGAIDAALYQLVVSEGIHQRYADQYL
jgi:HD-GYP domain-containing protein (c-di-GMP phosphodiesterase class II)/HAMP domain-containing protein